MKSITVHNIEKELAQKIEQEAKKRGLSLNKTIKQLLALSLGHDPKKTERRKKFEMLAGVWSREEADEFNKAVKVFEKIDFDDWK